MDRIEIGKKAKELFQKYKFVLIILVLGVFLMKFPAQEQDKPAPVPDTTLNAPITLAEELEVILSQISGVGKVSVLLTESESSSTIYQTDEDHSSSADSESKRVETVIISNSNREEAGLVRTVTPPIYLGAIVVCQGADSSVVRLSIVEAVSNATGISSDRITVLKMK